VQIEINFFAWQITAKKVSNFSVQNLSLSFCNGGDKVVAQYALSGYDQPIGVSDYQLSKAIPDNLKIGSAYGGRSRGGTKPSNKLKYGLSD